MTAMVTISILITGLSILNSKLVDEDSSVSKTIDCTSNLSTSRFSEEYGQRKNVKKKLDKQLADLKRQLHEN